MAEVPRSADVVIIGGGVHGASLAYHLARKKAGRVVLIEKKFIASGPTGRSTAIVRRFYGMDFFTRTASAAAEIFRHWTDVIGGDGNPGFQQVGYAGRGRRRRGAAPRAERARAQEIGARVALIAPAEVKALVPHAMSTTSRWRPTRPSRGTPIRPRPPMRSSIGRASWAPPSSSTSRSTPSGRRGRG